MSTENFYNPDHSHIHEQVMSTWLMTKDLNDLTVIPGLGDRTRDQIIRHTTSTGQVCDTAYALLGRYLALKTQNMTPVEHANAFYEFLTRVCEVHSGNVHQIVTAVAEKANLMMDGLYDIKFWPESTRNVSRKNVASSQPSSQHETNEPTEHTKAHKSRARAQA